MSEQLEILNQFGVKAGEQKLRAQVHLDGDWHASAHLWFIDEECNILLQKRTANKKLFPNMWVAPVSGHISAGDTAVETIVSEASEELDVEINKSDCFLQAYLRGTFDEDPIHEHEYIYIFVTHKIPQINLNIRNEEVAGLKWFSHSEFKDMVQNMDERLVPTFEEYEVILSYIKYNFLGS